MNDISSNTENKEENNDNKTKPTYSLLDQRIDNEFLVLIIIVSLISYIVGYYGLTFLWVILLLYQATMWYVNTIKENKERIKWTIKREEAIDKVFIYYCLYLRERYIL